MFIFLPEICLVPVHRRAKVIKKSGIKNALFRFVLHPLFIIFAVMKKYFLIPAVLLCLACSEKKGEETVVAETPPVSLATEISRQSRLCTAEYVVHKIVTHNDLKRLNGSFFGLDFNQRLPIGDRKIAIPVDVTLQACIDFSQISDKDILQDGDRLHIILPDPHIVVTSSKVDNEGIRTHVGLFRSQFKDAELTELSRQGMASVLQSVPQMGIIETSRRNAAALLIPLLVDMGYAEDRITITFRKDFDTEDMPTLFDSERSAVRFKD